MLHRITMSIAGEQQYVRAFDVLAADARDLSEPLGEVHGHLRTVVGQQFETEGGHGGSKWRELDEHYADRKAERWGDGLPILVASGDMRAAWLARDPLELTPRRLVMGPPPGSPEEVRSAAHQTGGGHVPQRKIVNLTGADRRIMDRIVVEYLSSRTRRLVGL